MSVAVIKLGGELLDEKHADELKAIVADCRRLLDGGRRLIFVHGGGPQTTALQTQLGQTPRMVAGRRVTDRAALEVLLMVVGGRLNVELCSALRAGGINAFGMNGVSGGAIRCVRRPPKKVAGEAELVDFGLVGDIVGIERSVFHHLLEGGLVPVVSSIGGDAKGTALNVNADLVASGIAAGYPAECLVMLTGAPGVLRDINDPSSRIPRLTMAEASKAIADGVVKGGMIAKLEETMGAVRQGVAAVQIMGRVQPGDLVRALETPGSVGTQLVP